MNRARKERISAIGSVIILLGIAFLIQIVTIVNKYYTKENFDDAFRTGYRDSTPGDPNLFVDLNLVQCPFIFTKDMGLIGCRAKDPSITGILYIVFDDNDIKQLVESDEYSDKYAVVISVKHTSKRNLEYLLKSQKVINIILSNCESCGMELPEHWSPAEKSPNFKYGLYGNIEGAKPYEWNKHGVEVIFKKHGVPISIENVKNSPDGREDKSKLIKAALENKQRGYKKYPLNAVMVKTKFYGLPFDGDCFRDNTLAEGLCTPFGGQSVWASYLDKMSRNDGRPLVLILGKIDTSGFVNQRNFGSEIFKTSMLSLIAILKFMMRFKMDNNLDDSAFRKNIIFSFFDAEFFGFSGSKMFVRDIINHPDCQSRSPADNCPITEAECTRPCFFHFRFPEINFGNIEYILEIDQISKLYEDMADKNSSEVYMHIPHYDAKTLSLVDKYLGEIPVVNDDYTGGKETTLGSINFKMAFESPEASPGIPPSSAMSFLERKQIPTIVFTGYREQFNNPYYYSFLDQKHTWSRNHLLRMCTFVETVAKNIIYDTLKPEYAQNIVFPKIDCKEIDELFLCFTINIKCPNIKKVFPEVDHIEHENSRNGAFLYRATSIPYIVARIITNIMSLEVGEKCIKNKECKSNFICSNHEIHDNGDAGYGRCYKVSAYYHPSYSPGFEFDYSRGSFVITNPNLGTWATVMDLDVNSYLIKVTSTRYQLLQLAIGIFKILGTIALLILFKWKRKAIRRIASNANRVADRGNGVSPQSVNPAIHI